MVFEWYAGISSREVECRASPAATGGPWKAWKRRNCSRGRSPATGKGCASPPGEPNRRTRRGFSAGRRVSSSRAGRLRRRGDPFRSAADVYERYRFLLSGSPVEVFVAALLDVKHRPLREERVSSGILDGSLIHPREVFAAAVRERAAAVLLLHNHPSGDPCLLYTS